MSKLKRNKIKRKQPFDLLFIETFFPIILPKLLKLCSKPLPLIYHFSDLQLLKLIAINSGAVGHRSPDALVSLGIICGTFTRSAGLISAIYKQLKLVNLKPVKKIQVKFDPFHPQALTAREFLYHINTPYVQDTNINCIIKADVVCDRSEPQIKIDLIDSRTIKFLANNLTVLDILQQINKHISSKVEVEEVEVAPTLSAKTSIKKIKKR